MKTTPKILIPLVGFFVITGVCWWHFRDPDRVPQIAFESIGWQRADPIANHRTVRSQMIEDLLRQHEFKGWTRQQVLELLGEPSRGEPSELGFPQFDIVYVLGMECNGAWSLDDEALGFKFDSADRVASYGVSVN